VGEGASLLVLREGKSDFTRDTLLEAAGIAATSAGTSTGDLATTPAGATAGVGPKALPPPAPRADAGRIVPIEQWPGARCNRDFCTITLTRAGRRFVVLMSRGRDLVPIPELARACATSDIVIADRRLPWPCKPRLLKADRALLRRQNSHRRPDPRPPRLVSLAERRCGASRPLAPSGLTVRGPVSRNAPAPSGKLGEWTLTSKK